MAFKVFLFVFLVVLISEAVFGAPDCIKDPFENCIVPRVFTELPREASEFNLRCQETQTHMRCLKDYQDVCGTDQFEIFDPPELFDATDNLLTDLCQEGTLLNSVASEHVNCFSDTLSNTHCRNESEAVIQPHITAMYEDPEWEYTTNLYCLEGALTQSCATLALLNNCEKIVAEVTLELMSRAKILEYYCSVAGAKSVLDNLDKFELTKEQRGVVQVLLEKLVVRNSR